MNFSWTEEQKELYATSVDFAKKQLRQLSTHEDEAGEFDRQSWQRCGEHGILAALIPEEHGGLGRSALDSAIMIQGLGYGCTNMGLAFSMAAHIYACTVPLIRFGSDDLKAKYLPGMGSGKLIATHSVTEPEAGSDAFAMRTRAERRGDHYVLNGTKCFASNAPVADLFVIHAATTPDAGFMGISAFVVERGTPGLSVSKPYKKIGLRTAPLGDIYLEDCHVPISNRLGAEGNGGVIFTHSMNWERTCLFAAYLGAMERQLEETIRYARERKQSQRPIAQFQGVSHRIVNMKVRLEAARWLIYRGAWLLDNEPPSLISMDSAIAKLFLSEAAVESGLDAIQVHGGLGIMSEGNIEKYLRDAIPSRIFSGTSEVQRNTIARVLGLQ